MDWAGYSLNTITLLALAGCETDDFFITEDGSDDCPTDTGETTSDAASTTSARRTSWRPSAAAS